MDSFDIEIKLKSYLNKCKIRLCDEPYTINNVKGFGLKKLAESLSKELNHQNCDFIEEILDELRKKALLNIQNISKFKDLNVCSIKVYHPKQQTEIVIEIEEGLTNETGASFKQRLCRILNIIDNGRMRMIFKGKLINDIDLLLNIGIKNNSRVMLLNFTEQDCQAQEVGSMIDQTRKMAEYLSDRSIDGKFKSSSFTEIEITDQSGQVLQLTNEQKSNITYGLTMHKQATNFILQNKYEMALLHCLEADEAFTKSNYCDQVDNVAILQLDIVWCYFCLQNVEEISESKRRLEVCEQRMVKCYGEGNERIKKIRAKRTFEGVPESIHIFRLYLMKGILAYYENDNGNAVIFLNKALELYNSLSVPDELIVQVMQLGFTHDQAIEGLRINKNVSIAVEYICRRIEDCKNLESVNEEIKVKNSIVKRLGLTVDKSKIDLTILTTLIEKSHMAPSLCLAAIKRSNNRYDEALELLFNSEHELRKDVDLAKHRGEVYDGDISYEAVVREKNAVQQIKDLVNEDITVIKRCLRQSEGNVDRAIDILLNEDFNLSSSSTSSTSSINADNNIKDSESVELEEAIYRNIGEGSSNNLETNYRNPDLFNEINAFNKFANLLKMPSISSINQNIKWN